MSAALPRDAGDEHLFTLTSHNMRGVIIGKFFAHHLWITSNVDSAEPFLRLGPKNH